VASSRDRARWLACSSATLSRSASISAASRAASAARAFSIDVSWDWSSLNRLSSDDRPPARGPETVLPVVPLADVGFAATLPAAPTGGALVPLVVVDLVSAGARGFVSGFGRFGDGAFPVLAARFIAVRDGWRVLLGRLAPIAGSFRGWSSPSCSSSMVALRLRVTLVASDGPDSFLSGDELLIRGNLDILCSWATVADGGKKGGASDDDDEQMIKRMFGIQQDA
jgi:hypothetical protein